MRERECPFCGELNCHCDPDEGGIWFGLTHIEWAWRQGLFGYSGPSDESPRTKNTSCPGCPNPGVGAGGCFCD